MNTRLIALMLGLGSVSTAWAADPTIEELLLATDDVVRGESSVASTEMYVKTARYERTMKMKTWSMGTDKTLVVIMEPAKDQGTATLKVDDNIWNYLPKVDRTMKVPASMMSGSWMGLSTWVNIPNRPMSKSLPFLGCILRSISTLRLDSSSSLSSCCLRWSSASLSSLILRS